MKTFSLMAVGALVTGALKAVELITRTDLSVSINMDRAFELELERELGDTDYRFRNDA